MISHIQKKVDYENLETNENSLLKEEKMTDFKLDEPLCVEMLEAHMRMMEIKEKINKENISYNEKKDLLQESFNIMKKITEIRNKLSDDNEESDYIVFTTTSSSRKFSYIVTDARIGYLCLEHPFGSLDRDQVKFMGFFMDKNDAVVECSKIAKEK
jgi:hypothetical protein